VSDLFRRTNLEAMGDNQQFRPLNLGVDNFDLSSRWERSIGEIEVLFGHGALEELGNIARSMGVSNALLVTDRRLMRAGHPRRARQVLEESSIQTSVFSEVAENPSSHAIGAAAETLSTASIDLIVALGGGSCLDFAKGLNFLLTNGGSMEDYWGWGRAQRPMLPSVGIPTTAGTGSDAQSYAVISRSSDQRKMACGDPKARFQKVILDPDLTGTVPRSVRTATGFDAIAHAVESFASSNRTAASQALAKSAWQLLEPSFPPSLKPDATSETLSSMLIGAHLAGASIEQSMLGAAHACANPLTARFNMTHGLAVAIMLPQVVRYNSTDNHDPYSGLFDDPPTRDQASEGRTEGLADRLDSHRKVGRLPTSLSTQEVPEQALPELAQAATSEWTGRFNPRPMTAADFLAVYRLAY
jgi:alcohol dehydrogenase